MMRKPVVDEQWPYLTADLPGIGGAIKRHDEDFVVEELPLYEPLGQGTHTYFTIEKRGLTTLAAVGHIARALGRQSRDIGYAGLKDAHGITRQMLSVEHVDPSRVEALELSRIRIRAVSRHTNKLKLGHLAGNRFAITVRDMVSSPIEQVEPIIETLARRGVPNYFGPQRFGVRGDNAQVGRAVLVGDYGEAVALMLGRPASVDHGAMRTARELFDAGDLEAAAKTWPREFAQQARICRALIKAGGDARRAWKAVDHTLRKFYVSAVQSELFNQVLARRIGTLEHFRESCSGILCSSPLTKGGKRGVVRYTKTENALDQLQDGDIAWKHHNGACFHVEDADVEQPRCAAFEISPSGPLFGKKMMEPQGQPGQLETEVLEESGLAREQLHTQDGTKLNGARRPLRVPLTEPGVDAGTDQNGAYLRLSFALPPGAYATSVSREVCKTSTA